MNSKMEHEVALHSLEKARDQIKKENYGRAFAHFLVVFELLPNKKSDLESEFLYVLSEWGLFLEKQNRLQDLYSCYKQALNYFPSSVEILNNFGLQLLRLEENEEAKKYFDMAYILNKNHLPSEKNLFISKINILPRWHFRMLNDIIRNEAYLRALELNISRKFSRVLDIGAGCGLLSLFAFKCNDFQSITAVEESPVLVDIARNICRENGFNNITLINKISTELNGNICGYHNLLVTEIFDAAFFGEHVLETLIHAWENLLEISSKVIPSFAQVFITGISSQEILKKHRFLNNTQILNIDGICLTQLLKEPYEAENVSEDTLVTTTENFVTVNFNDVIQLKNLYINAESIPPVTLTALKDCEIHAYAVWFNLNLDDHNFITTDPRMSNVSCWEQAVIYIHHPLKVYKNQKVKVKLSCAADKLQLQQLDYNPNCSKCFKVSQEIITFLNDENLLQNIFNLSEKFNDTDMVILDLNPFPVFGILMAKKGCKVHCMMNVDADLEFLNYVCEKNLVLENVDVLSDDAYNSLLNMNDIYDIIYFDAVNSNGTLNDKFLGKFSLFKKLLKNSGTILPNRVDLKMQVVSSDYLEKCCRVNDANCLGFKIAEQMNEYAVPELWELDYKNVSFEKISETVTLWNVVDDENEREIIVEVIANKSNYANAVLCWFDIFFDDTVPFDTTKSSHYKITSFLLTSPRYLEKDNVLTLQVKQHRGLLKINNVS